MGSGICSSPPRQGAGFPRQGHQGADFRPGLPPERNFPHSLFGNSPLPGSGNPFGRSGIFSPGLREAGFSLWIHGFRVFPSLSKKLWIAGSLHREGRRSPGSGIPPPGSPESGIFGWERDSLFRNFFCWGAGFPRRGHRGAGFSTGSFAGVVGSGVFPRRGEVQGVKGHSILHCTPWLAGILRSVDSICWQGADLEAVAFSCTGRRLARAANGLGFRVQGLGFRV